MRAKKSFGQHFLKDQSVVRRIVTSLAPINEDLIVEVGPGTGVLTEELSPVARELVLIEADREMIPDLEMKFPNARLFRADAAKVDFSDVTHSKSWILVGNLPYNASAAILANAIESENPPGRMVVMVQKEQGDRMRAQPGETGLLSVVVQLCYDVKKLFDVPPSVFIPKPRVNSSVLSLVRKGDAPDLESYRGIVGIAKAGFSSRRKQLHKNLSRVSVASSEQVKNALEELGLSPKSRAQELSIEQWTKLNTLLHDSITP